MISLVNNIIVCKEFVVDSIRLLTFIPASKVLYLFGAGERGQRFYRAIKAFAPHLHIAGFIDSTVTGSSQDVKIYPPSILDRLDTDTTLILITTHQWAEVEAVVAQYGLRSFRSDIEYLRNIFSGRSRALGSQVIHQFTAEDMVKMEPMHSTVLSALHDPRAQCLYRKLLSMRGWHYEDAVELTAEYGLPEMQYLEWLEPQHVRTLIEGGLYDGRATYALIHACDDPKVYGFEPLEGCYEKGIYYDYLSRYADIRVEKSGLWDTDGEQPFSDNEYCSCISDMTVVQGSRVIPTRSIDSYVAELSLKPDLIKLDVEGAEMQVLHGAMSTIREHRPQIAVAIYHSHEDMINIPHFLITHLKNYRFHIGHYSTGIIETIFYAIPAELT